MIDIGKMLLFFYLFTTVMNINRGLKKHLILKLYFILKRIINYEIIIYLNGISS